MNRLLVVFVLLVACVIGLGFYQGWFHVDQDKIYYVLEGRGRFRVGADEQTVEAGEAVVARAGVEHGLVNDGQAPLVALVVVTPPPAHP